MTNKPNDVERLAENMYYLCREKHNSFEFVKWKSLDPIYKSIYIKQAEHVFALGYIHKERVLDMVELCRQCTYTRLSFMPCEICDGKGIVLKSEDGKT